MEEKDKSDGWVPRIDEREVGTLDGDGMVLIL